MPRPLVTAPPGSRPGPSTSVDVDGRAAAARAERDRWVVEDTAKVIDICNKVFGGATTLIAAAAVVCWHLGEVSALTVGLLWLYPLLNLMVSRYGAADWSRGEATRLVVNTPLLLALYRYSDGPMTAMWLPILINAAGAGLAWSAITRRVERGYAVTLWHVGLLGLAAIDRGTSLAGALWPCVAVAVVGLVLSTVVARLGVTSVEARLKRAEAEAHKRDLQRSVEELARRTRGLRLILDSTAQGFITVDLAGVMVSERSAIVDRWFGPAGTDTTFAALLARHDREVAAWFGLALDSLREGVMPPEVCLDQLPARVTADGRTLEIRYTLLADVAPTRLLLVVSDETEHLERERIEREQREAVVLFQRITADRAGFEDFLDEVERLVDDLARPREPVIERRALHTLKGTCASYGLEGFAGRCHRLERELDEGVGRLGERQRAELVMAWRAQTAQVRRLIGDSPRCVIEIETLELADAVERARQAAPGSELAALLASWRLELATRRLERLGSYAVSLAARLGRSPLDVRVDAAGVRLDPTRWAPLWTALIHAVRNAVDHGIEEPAARIQAGKPPRPCLTLVATIDRRQLAIAIADDGVGVDWDRVRDRALDRGLPAASPADLERALFADGFSTRDEVSETSGRGVGLAALRATVESLGGEVEIDSRPGQGTTVCCRFPAPPSGPRPRVTSQPIRALA